MSRPRPAAAACLLGCVGLHRISLRTGSHTSVGESHKSGSFESQWINRGLIHLLGLCVRLERSIDPNRDRSIDRLGLMYVPSPRQPLINSSGGLGALVCGAVADDGCRLRGLSKPD